MTCASVLRRARRARVLRKGGWDAGTDPDYLDELIAYWRDDYDWRAQERALNQLAHYIARIDAAQRALRPRDGAGRRLHAAAVAARLARLVPALSRRSFLT